MPVFVRPTLTDRQQHVDDDLQIAADGEGDAVRRVRGGQAWEAMRDLAGGADVLVCDAETDADLAAIAEASLALGGATIWAGSAGLAGWLVEAMGLARPLR